MSANQDAMISLEEIASKLEEASDHWEHYLNITTGEFVSLADGMYVPFDEDLANEIHASGDYYCLPNQHEIHEYRIMVRFAESLTNPQKQAKLFRALNGKRAYRRFKDEINFLGIAHAYYHFREQAFLEIAQRWCEFHEIQYTHESTKGRKLFTNHT